MPENALLIIDLQSVYLPGMYRPGPVLDRVAALADRARGAGAPVVYLRQVVPPDEVPAGADPRELLGPVAPHPGDVVLDKHSADVFLDTGLAELLRDRGVRRIVVTGYSTEFCVDTAVRSGLSAGFDVTLVTDGHLTSLDDDPTALAPEAVVAHHNRVLGAIGYAHHAVTLTRAADVPF
ncbi:isochorismatase [Actinocatenispora thailandica]|uniref:Isochorismatase n=1 Tax=Actinocatenispora thailandica TaxID=227318 RepID=A0A7R7DQY2_9ACTN|nr:isochorismatase family protein [Actinocatenispora thailandica]BCJ36249.1 isochorismatase [Actinocatenispora thailandica]